MSSKSIKKKTVIPYGVIKNSKFNKLFTKYKKISKSIDKKYQ